jgi:hypothetical protein
MLAMAETRWRLLATRSSVRKATYSGEFSPSFITSAAIVVVSFLVVPTIPKTTAVLVSATTDTRLPVDRDQVAKARGVIDSRQAIRLIGELARHNALT